MNSRVKFLKTGLFNRRIGAIVRSSRFVVQDVMAIIGHRRPLCIVEYGPGDGVMTKELLKCLDPDGILLAVEANPNFLKILENIKDHRLKLVESTIQEVSANLSEFGMTHPDLIVSSIPFSYLKPAEREQVIKDSAAAMKRGSTFIIFHQYSRLMLQPMKRFFQKVDVKLEPRNFLPCFILSATKE